MPEVTQLAVTVPGVEVPAAPVPAKLNHLAGSAATRAKVHV